MIILNVPNEPYIDKEILKELEKDENLFGAISRLKVVAKSSSSQTTNISMQYADRSVHENVIRYYRWLKPQFHGQSLIFKPSFRSIEDLEESVFNNFVELMDFNRNCKDHEMRDVAIINLKNVENIFEEVFDEVKKDENFFGPIESFKVVRNIDRSKNARAFIRYFDRSVHKSVIDYYIKKKPKFHGLPIYFVPSKCRILDDFKNMAYCVKDNGNEVYTSWNNNLIKNGIFFFLNLLSY